MYFPLQVRETPALLGPNTVGVSFASPEDGNRSSFLDVVFL
jgi:hypothetical protein